MKCPFSQRCVKYCRGEVATIGEGTEGEFQMITEAMSAIKSDSKLGAQGVFLRKNL